MSVVYAFISFAAIWIGAAFYFAGTDSPFTAIGFWIGSLIWLDLARREQKFRN